jgi:hypothetical protein
MRVLKVVPEVEEKIESGSLECAPGTGELHRI